jgi:hypothetical protein
MSVRDFSDSKVISHIYILKYKCIFIFTYILALGIIMYMYIQLCGFRYHSFYHHTLYDSDQLLKIYKSKYEKLKYFTVSVF